jgi:hypothetical protein
VAIQGADRGDVVDVRIAGRTADHLVAA